jgi:hypothetical protein
MNYLASAFFAAHRLFCAAAILRRAAALILRFGFPESVVASAAAFAGGRPRRFAGEESVSIARLSLSRSAISRATMWSVAIHENRNTSSTPDTPGKRLRE